MRKQDQHCWPAGFPWPISANFWLSSILPTYTQVRAHTHNLTWGITMICYITYINTNRNNDQSLSLAYPHVVFPGCLKQNWGDKISIRFSSKVTNYTQNSNTEKSVLNGVKCLIPTELTTNFWSSALFRLSKHRLAWVQPALFGLSLNKKQRLLQPNPLKGLSWKHSVPSVNKQTSVPGLAPTITGWHRKEDATAHQCPICFRTDRNTLGETALVLR